MPTRRQSLILMATEEYTDDLIHHIMPYYGACDFESLDEYESWLKQVV